MLQSGNVDSNLGTSGKPLESLHSSGQPFKLYEQFVLMNVKESSSSKEDHHWILHYHQIDVDDRDCQEIQSRMSSVLNRCRHYAVIDLVRENWGKHRYRQRVQHCTRGIQMLGGEQASSVIRK